MNWLYTWLGLSNASGAQYLFWSGIFGDITIFSGLVLWYVHNQCHVEGCRKIGKHPFKHYKLCRKHHPEMPEHVTHLHIQHLHKKNHD